MSWNAPPPDRTRRRLIATGAAILLAPLLAALPSLSALAQGRVADALRLLPIFLLACGVSAAVAVGTFRNALRGFTPPRGVAYVASDPELGAEFAGIGLNLEGRAFENVIRSHVSGTPFTYFEAVDCAGRSGYLVIELDGQLPDVIAVREGGVAAGATGSLQVAGSSFLTQLAALRNRQFPREPAPLNGPRLGPYRMLQAPPGSWVRDFATMDVVGVLGTLSVPRWHIHDRYLVASLLVNAGSRARAWPNLRRAAAGMAALKAAIPADLLRAIDPGEPGGRWPLKEPRR